MLLLLQLNLDLLLHNTLLLFQVLSDLLVDMALDLLLQILLIHKNGLPLLVLKVIVLSGYSRYDVAIHISLIVLITLFRNLILIQQLSDSSLIVELLNRLVYVCFKGIFVETIIEVLAEYLFLVLLFEFVDQVNRLIIIVSII